MAGIGRVRVLSDDFSRCLLDVSRVPKDIVDEVMKPEAVLHAQELMKLTFPRKEGGDAKGTSAGGKGKASIEQSVRRVFISSTSDEVARLYPLNVVIGEGKDNTIKNALERCKQKKPLAVLLGRLLPMSSGGKDFVLQEATPEAVNQRRRYTKKSHGKASRNPGEGKLLSSDAAIRRTIRTLNKEVGGAKKGWVIPGVKAPAWVMRANGPLGESTEMETRGLTRITVANNERAMDDIESRSGIADFVCKLRGKKIEIKMNFLMRRRYPNG